MLSLKVGVYMFEPRKKYESYKASAGFSSDEPSLTQQQFKDECDINVLYARYQQTGVFYPPFDGHPTNSAAPVFGDFSSDDYGDMMAYQNSLVRVREAFEQLPLAVRERFNYNPINMVEFLSDPANTAEAQKLGLLKEVKNAPATASGSVSVPSGTGEKAS